MRAAFADGIGWGDAKQALFEVDGPASGADAGQVRSP